ncbi:hypothetical protein PAEPH01_1534 [Pancytospora epiphaga]|nr:hypothetical protein PAEPH01_1534 [Pancytospora epiphaga]
MLQQLYNTLEESAPISIRRAAILKQEWTHSTHLVTIATYMTMKYGLSSEDTLSNKAIEEAQKWYLYNEIRKKPCHEKLYRM